jgi:ribonuclease HI
MKWDIEQQKAFKDLKLYLEHLLTLSSPEQGEPLILYVSAMHSVVSGVLVVEKEITRDDKIAKQRFLVYFVSEVLTGSKKHYSKMEKLRHYFEAHTIKVLTNQLLNDIFGNRGSSNRISKWAMELLEYVVDFEKRSMIKYKILADFIAEWTEPSSLTEGIVPESPWLIYCDGAWGYTGVGIATMLISPSGIKPRYAARLQFTNEADKYMNNIAEYEAILLGLCKLRAIRVQTCILHIDSKIVASQIEKECITRKPTLEKYLGLVRRMENHFKGFTVEYIERSKKSQSQ